MTVAAAPTGRDRGRLLPEPGPARMLAVATFVTSAGFGGYSAGSVLFFTRFAGLPAREVGLGLSLAGLLALFTNPRLGRLADRFGPRRLVVLLGLAQAVGLVCCVLVSSTVSFLLVICVLSVAEQGGYVCRGALTSALLGSAGRVRVSAYLRSVLNAGYTIGALAAGIAAGLDSRPAYLVLLVVVACVTALGTGCYLLTPPTPSARSVNASAPDRPRRDGVRDFPYVLTGVLTGVVGLGESILLVGLPLWVIGHTAAPSPVVMVMIGLNTVLVVLFQVRAGRRADTVDGARSLLRLAALVLAVACLGFLLAGALPAVPAVLTLVAGAVALTAAELWNSAAGWGLAFNLAPPDAQGTYLGAFSLGGTVQVVAGPALVTVLVSAGSGGWLVLAALFALVAPATDPVVAWALRGRRGQHPPAGSSE